MTQRLLVARSRAHPSSATRLESVWESHLRKADGAADSHLRYSNQKRVLHRSPQRQINRVHIRSNAIFAAPINSNTAKTRFKASTGTRSVAAAPNRANTTLNAAIEANTGRYT